MRTIHARIATSHVDLHGDRVTKEALEGMAQQTNHIYIPFLNEHDVRQPVGRVTKSKVTRLDDGEFALDAEVELWEPGDDPDSLRGDGRRMVLRIKETEAFAVGYDLGADEADLKDLEKLAELGGQSLHMVRKKAAEPTATFLIEIGIIAAGAVAAGFFGKLGGDLYDGLKRGLKRLFGRRKKKGVLDIQISVRHGGNEFEVHVVLENPSPHEIEVLFEGRFPGVDETVARALRQEPDLARVVVEWHDGRVTRAFAMRSDAVPLEIEPPAET